MTLPLIGNNFYGKPASYNLLPNCNDFLPNGKNSGNILIPIICYQPVIHRKTFW